MASSSHRGSPPLRACKSQGRFRLPMAETSTPIPTPSARALLKERDYIAFWLSRWTGSFAAQIQSVAMGWQIYGLARAAGKSVEESAFVVGMLGAVSFLPVFLLALTAGEVADRHDRKAVLVWCFA